MIYDVLIIGAGPCGLAVASRLWESTPSALFTDAEHERYWKKSNICQNTLEHEGRQRHARRAQQVNQSRDSQASGHSSSMVVLDATAESWMALWRSRFNALNISHLRSPLFFHCDPRDRDGLLAYSYAKDRVAELQEISNVVGKEVSKHQRKKSRKSKSCQCSQSARHLRIDGHDQIDYFAPSSGLFDDYCNNMIERYDLNNLIQQAEVSDISYGDVGITTEESQLFTVTTASKQMYLARVVVLAIGPGENLCPPAEFQTLSTSNPRGSICHIFDQNGIQCSHLPSQIHGRLKQSLPVHIAIVGGGLTSAQTVAFLLKQYPKITKIYLICRSKLKVKHFDVDLNWVSKLRNHAMSTFWSADTDEERFQMLKSARNGGSIPPAWEKTLRNLVKAGKLEILEETSINTSSSTWDDERKEWDLNLTSTSTKDFQPQLQSTLVPPTSISVSHLLLATSQPPNIDSLPYLSTLRSTNPILSINGLPQLTHDLKWTEEVPLFLTGALAGLRLGPGAGNLAGARQGAERIAWGIEALLGKDWGRGRDGTGRKSDRSEYGIVKGYTGGFENRFDVLDSSGSD